MSENVESKSSNPLSNDRMVLDGRENTLADEIPQAPLRDQIPAKLAAKLKEIGINNVVRSLWSVGNADRTEWLNSQETFLLEFEEFVKPIYDAPYSWSSTQAHIQRSMTSS